ncbi:MAG: CPBP family intramembrane glutamic endopeptidase [Marinicella sp.]
MRAYLNQVGQKWPYVSRMLLGVILVVVAFVLTGLFEKITQIKPYFPFTGVVLLVFVTWLLYKTEGKNLNELGLNLRFRNIKLLLLGLIIGTVAFIMAKYLRFLYAGEDLVLNDMIDWSLVGLGLYTILPMVAVEELLFRGYFFKSTVNKLGVLIANVIFATAFMLVHVIDATVISNLGMVIFLVITIPIGHLLFATALLKSNTLLFPIGLHLGNNWASMHVISNMKQPDSISYVVNSASFDTWGSFLLFIIIWNSFFLLLTYVIWKWPVSK